jgi:ATP-dependent protease ClpP protease subunit
MNKNDIDDELIEGILMSSKSSVKPKSIATLYEFYISGTILAPENYINDFDIIRHAREDDEIRIYLNTYGGDMYTAIQFMRVLSETSALVTCSVEGACMSAGTLIFLNADVFEVTPHSSFMIHNYSGGTIGKGAEMHAQIIHEKKWSEKLFKEVYEDFLTTKEIDEILAGRDLWMEVEEVAERMNKRIITRRELAELDEITKPESE